MKIKYVKGDATKPNKTEGKLAVIPHICNDIGKWEKGFVVALSKRWRQPEEYYKRWYKEGKIYQSEDPFKLGNVQFVQVENDIDVANMVGQHTIWKAKDGTPPIRYAELGKAMRTVARYCLRRYNAEIHAPKFGAGLAGGDWSKIEKMIEEEWCDKGLSVTIYLFK